MREKYNHFYHNQISKLKHYLHAFTNFLLLITGAWARSDIGVTAALGLVVFYLAIKEPLLITVILLLGFLFYCLQKVITLTPFLNRLVGRKVRFWQVAGVIMGCAVTVSIYEMPAQAIFLSGLEQFLTDIAQQSSTGGAGGGAIDPQAIKLVFNAIRGVFLLLVGVAALFAYNQAQQGNDWRPIATQAGLAIGIILVIDVITFLFIGNGTGGGTGGTGGAGT
ncbi:MAG: hypothetical protein KME29_33440 [Calothrix sp. FI2-JRJ7]|jgi:hypothetical protein|nr:hypothetical protein [Calothrix sp. FI2-JRJ7]